MPRPSLEVFKARLDGALGSLGCYEMWEVGGPAVLGGGGGWSFVILEVGTLITNHLWCNYS